jgi:hypothetical protein
MRKLASLLTLVGCLSAVPAVSVAAPMECNEDYLRMALGGRGTLPQELLRVCLHIDHDDPAFGPVQYAISLHFRRRHDFPRAATFLERASRARPFATNPRILYLLAQYQIAAGRTEKGLLAKDRFLTNSSDLSQAERIRRTARLYRLLHDAYEIKAVEAADDEQYEEFRVAANFYQEAHIHLERDLRRLSGGIADASAARPGGDS